MSRLALALALALTALPAVVFAQPAPTQAPPGEPAPAEPAPNSGPRTFKSEAAPTGQPRTPEQALDHCIADVKALERDAIGVPFLGAAYIAFFVILGVFFVLVRVKQRRMEEEMSELKERLARLQGGAQ